MDYYEKILSCLSLILAITQILALSLNEQAQPTTWNKTDWLYYAFIWAKYHSGDC